MRFRQNLPINRRFSREGGLSSVMRGNSIPGGWIVCVMFSCLIPHAAATRHLQTFPYPVREESNGSYQPPPRVLIDAFFIHLRGLSQSLDEVDLGDLLNVLETTASEFLMEKSSDSVPLEFVKFTRLIQEFREDEATTPAFVTVDVEDGVARYKEHPAPDSRSVQNWVKESLEEENLLPRLQSHENANLRSITSTTMGSKYPDIPVGESTTRAANDDGARMGTLAMGAMIGSLIGIFVVGMAVGGFLLVRKRRNQSQVVNLGEASIADVDSFKPPPMFSNNERYGMRRAVSDPDARSIAGSESEWTVATEAGDSMAIKSIHPNGIVPSSPNTGALMLSESFERDRQVAITKDMLTSQWSGQVKNQRGPQPSTESVLQPSYFSATVERQHRENRADTAHLLPDMDSSSYSSSGTNNTDRKKSSPRQGKQVD